MLLSLFCVEKMEAWRSEIMFGQWQTKGLNPCPPSSKAQVLSEKYVVCHMAYSALYLKKLGICYHIESMSTLKIEDK